jgi:hypothetical protein
VELTFGPPPSTLLRQHSIDAEAARPAHEQQQGAAEDRKIFEEVVVLGHHLGGRIFPIAVGERGGDDEEEETQQGGIAGGKT